MSDLKEPLLATGYPDVYPQVAYSGFHPVPPPVYPSHPGFLTTMEHSEESTVVGLRSVVKAAVQCFKGIAFGLENGIVALFETSGDIREIGHHTSAITALACEGNLLVAGTADGKVRIWNLDTYQETQPATNHSGPVTLIAICPNATAVLSASPTSCDLNNVATGMPGKLAGHSTPVSCFAVSADQALAGCENGEVLVWNLVSRTCEHTFKGHTGRVNCVAFVSMSRIVSGSADGTLKVWDLKTGHEVGTLKGHKKAILCCAVTVDGARLASGSEDTQVRLWNLETLRNDFIFTGHQSEVRHLFITPDSNYLVSASNNVLVNKLDDPHEIAHLAGHTNAITNVMLTPDYQYIASGSIDQTLRIWGKKFERPPAFHKAVPQYPQVNVGQAVPQYPQVNVGQAALLYPQVNQVVPGTSQFANLPPPQFHPLAPTEPLLSSEPGVTAVPLYENRARDQWTGNHSEEIWWGYKCSAISICITLVICFFIMTS